MLLRFWTQPSPRVDGPVASQLICGGEQVDPTARSSPCPSGAALRCRQSVATAVPLQPASLKPPAFLLTNPSALLLFRTTPSHLTLIRQQNVVGPTNQSGSADQQTQGQTEEGAFPPLRLPTFFC